MRNRLICFFGLGKPQRVYVLAIVVGLIAGLTAVILKNTVHYTQILLTSGFSAGEANWLYLLYPLFGLFLTVLFVNFWVRDSISHGISKILYAISKKNSRLKAHNMYTSMIGSTLTVGFGGSVGLEAPIVLTGSAVGSRLGQYLRLNYKTVTLLLACGATGAVAGIFKAPIAGVAFALEVIMIDLTMASLVPLMIAAATATSVAWFLMGDEVLISINLTDVFTVSELPGFLVLGVFAGVVSIYFSQGLRIIEGRMAKLQSTWIRWLLGGTVLAVLIILFPPLYGEGYESLRLLLAGDPGEIFRNSWWFDKMDSPWIFILAIALVILLKAVSTAVTTGAGGVGGVFAPCLFLGGISGFFLARVLNLLGWMEVSEMHFILAGMAGVMSGVMHAPLTAMFLIAEITGGYSLIIPLMVTVAIAYVTAHIVEPHSVYARRLAAAGNLITHNKDKATLLRMNVRSLLETDFITVRPEMTLGELVRQIAVSSRNMFPVTDDGDRFLGLIIMEKLRPVMFRTELYDSLRCRDLMYIPEYLVSTEDSVEQIAGKIQASGKFNLVVLDQDRYVGCVSRAKVFSTYRERMKEMSED